MDVKFQLSDGIARYRTPMMGIAIIWIMLFHSGIEAPEQKLLRALWYLFVSFGGGCGVDLFFILSGFGLYYSASKLTSSCQWFVWEKKRLIRILPSYIIVASIWYLLRHEFTLWNMFQLNFIVDGVRDFWFIPAIIICYVLFPTLYSIGRKIGFKLMTIVMTSIVLLVSLLLHQFASDYFNKTEIFLLRIPCFVLGIYIGYLAKESLNKEYHLVILAVAVLFGTCMLLHFPGDSRWTFTFGTILFIQLLIIAMKLMGRVLSSLLNYMGSRSLQVYLVHVSIGGNLGSLLSDKALSLTVYFIVSVLIAEIIFRITNLVFTSNK